MPSCSAGYILHDALIDILRFLIHRNLCFGTARRTLGFFDANLQAVDARRRLAQAAAQADGKLLSGGLAETPDLTDDDGLRGQALSQQ